MAKKKNTIPDPDARFRSWFIVCPNILANGICGLTEKDLEGMTPQEICDFVVTQWASATKQAACLYCISKVGMIHLHIVLCSINGVRFSTIKKFIGNKAHIEITIGTKKQVEAYINKTGVYEEKGETIIAKAQEGELIGRQGKRSDIALIREAIDAGMTWREVRRLKDEFFDTRMTTIIKNMYFDKRNLETPFKREVRVHWCFGASGSGKTGITLDLIKELGEEQIYLVSDYKNGFDIYAGEPILILDEFRGQLPYAILLGILEGYKKQIPARYANILGLWNDIYITTIKTPEQVYAKMIDSSEQDDDPISQLMGRITDLTYCYRVNRESGTKKDRNGQSCEFYRTTIPKNVYKELKGNIKEIEKYVRADYMLKHYQPGDICEALNI